MTQSSSGVIIIRNKAMTVNVENATIISDKMSIFFAHSDCGADAAWNLNVKDCVLYSRNNNPIFAATANYENIVKNLRMLSKF